MNYISITETSADVVNIVNMVRSVFAIEHLVLVQNGGLKYEDSPATRGMLNINKKYCEIKFMPTKKVNCYLDVIHVFFSILQTIVNFEVMKLFA